MNNFQVEIVDTENFLVLGDKRFCLIDIVGQQRGRNVVVDAAGECNKSFCVFTKKLFVDTRLVVEALEKPAVVMASKLR